MPMTVDLYPGKVVLHKGQRLVPFGKRVPPSCRKHYEPYSRASLASTEQFKAFQRMPDGTQLSLQQMGRNQDNYDVSRDNNDTSFMISQPKHPNPEEQWELLDDSFKIQVRRPRIPALHPS